MPIDFPNSPTLNQQYSYNGTVWQWNGAALVRHTPKAELHDLLHRNLKQNQKFNFFIYLTPKTHRIY